MIINGGKKGGWSGKRGEKGRRGRGLQEGRGDSMYEGEASEPETMGYAEKIDRRAHIFR